MRQQRGLFLVFGITTLVGAVASEARAETLTLSVFAGTDTTAPAIYSTTGVATSVTANTDVLNTALAGAGFGAYSFSHLEGSSDGPGSSMEGVGAYILTDGRLSVIAGGSGEGTAITVTLTEGGFTLPAGAPALLDRGQNNMVALSSGRQDTTGVFADATGMTVSTPTGTLTSHGEVDVLHPLASYVTPFSLDSQTTLSGTSAIRDPTVPGTIPFTQLVQVTSLPEPSSLVMAGLAALAGLGGWARRHVAA